MYVTSYTGPTEIPCKFSGGIYSCGIKTSHYKYGAIDTLSSVTSWRGKKDTSKPRAFTRLIKDVSATHRNLWYCGPLGKMEGGENWLVGITQHNMFSPKVPPFEYLTDSDLNYRAHNIAELYAKANSALFNGATFLAELRETIAYIKDILRTIVNKTVRAHRLSSRLRSPEGVWLEWRYAITPLILEVEEAISLLRNPKAREKVQNGFSHEYVENSQHIFSYRAGIHFNAEITTTIKGGSALWVNSQTDLAPYGTGFHDAIMAGWEVVRLSFVIDWFIGIGTWLESMRDTNLEIGERYATIVKDRIVKLWVDVPASSGEIIEFYDGPTSVKQALVFKTLHISRIIGDDVAAPTLPVLVPGRLSVLHTADAVALLIGFIKNLK